MAFNFNKIQDAVVKFLKIITMPILTLLKQVTEGVDKTLPVIRVESKETLDAFQMLAADCVKDMAAIRAAAVSALDQIGRTSSAVAIDITVETPGGGRYSVQGTVKSLPPDEGGGS